MVDHLEKSSSEAHVAGNLLLLYAFDIGDEIDFKKIRKMGLVPTSVTQPFQHFKNYHIPLSVNFTDLGGTGTPKREDAISCKIQNFGVVSFCYKVPHSGPFETLKVKIIDTVRAYEKIAREDAKRLFDAIKPAITSPNFFLLSNNYYAVQVNPQGKEISPKEFQKRFGPGIASLLRLETERLSQYQQDSILETTMGYYGGEFIVIDGESAFIYDTEYLEALEFFELANIQRLELQYFDQLLDRKLNSFYGQHAPKTSWFVYVPLMANRADTLLIELARLRADISVIAERLANSIKMVGDVYYEELYAALSNKMSLPGWKQSIDAKLNIIGDLYTVYRDRHSTVREEILTLVIIILIAVEALVAFIK